MSAASFLVTADDDPPFGTALREAHDHLMAAHCAAVGTLEAELQRMRHENTMLRMRLAHLGDNSAVSAPASCSAAEGTLGKPLFSGMASTATSSLHGVGGSGGAVGSSDDSGGQAQDDSCASLAAGVQVCPTLASATSVSTPRAEGGAAAIAVGTLGVSAAVAADTAREHVTSSQGDQPTAQAHVQHPLHPQAFQSPQRQPVVLDQARTQERAGHDVGTGLTTTTSCSLSTSSSDSIEEECGQNAELGKSPITAADLRRALSQLLQHFGLDHIDIQPPANDGDFWCVSGIRFLLRLDANWQRASDTSASNVGSDAAFGRLMASSDGGRVWEHAETLIGQHVASLRQHKQQHGRLSSSPEATRSAAVAELSRVPLQQHVSPQQQMQPQLQLQQHQQLPQRHQLPHQQQRVGTPDVGASTMPCGKAADMGPHVQPHTDGRLPVWRSDGLPAFNNAFPAAFDARSGSSHYYNQFRVRVPPSSQYDQ